MTDCDVAGVFWQNGAIQTGAGGRERLVEEWVRERERRERQETRQRGEKPRETDGGGGGTGKALTDSNGAS